MVNTFNGTGGADEFTEPAFNGDKENQFKGGGSFDALRLFFEITDYELIYEDGQIVAVANVGTQNGGQTFNLDSVELLLFTYFSLATQPQPFYDLGLDNPLTLPMAGSPDHYVVADFTGDGRDDILLNQTHWPQGLGAPANPVKLLENLGNGEFRDATAGHVVNGPSSVLIREFVAADFNGDGRIDVFGAASGPDVPPFPGEPDVLLLSGADGKLHGSPGNLPGISVYSHGAAAGDIDNDGDIDIFVATAPGTAVADKFSYFLINDGTGRFALSTDNIETPAPPAETFNLTENSAYNAASLVDLDNDGFLDLVVGGFFFTADRVYFNDGAGNFPTADMVLLPDGVFGNDATINGGVITGGSFTNEIFAMDLNGDGFQDLVMLQSEDLTEPTFGNGIQFILNNGDGTFTDDTAARGGFADSDGEGAFFIEPIDLNRDGHTDLLLHHGKAAESRGDNAYELTQPVALLNDGTGHFDGITNAFIGHTSMALWPFPQADGSLDFLFATEETLGDLAQEMTFFYASALAPYGTGPDGMDPATLGAAGFNEFYYLRHNPAAQSAVTGGQYDTGLDHYLAVGRQAGLQPAAPMLETSAQSDVAFGLVGADTMAAGAGDDRMFAFAGNDSLWGQDGNDTLFGGDGADRLFGNRNDDLLGGENGNDELKGHIGDDVLDGGAGDDVGFGGGNNDSVDGGAGNDTMGGNSGADTVSGGDGNDAVRGQGGPDQLFGGAGADTLVGHQGFDTLFGGDGNDLLIGAQANDQLTGGNGADSFVFVDDGGFDTVTDFEDGTDKLVMSGVSGLGALDIVDTPDGAQIGFGNTTVLVAGITAANLTASDFVFS